MCIVFFFFKQKTAYEMLRSLVGSEMCIRDRGSDNNTVATTTIVLPATDELPPVHPPLTASSENTDMMPTTPPGCRLSESESGSHGVNTRQTSDYVDVVSEVQASIPSAGGSVHVQEGNSPSIRLVNSSSSGVYHPHNGGGGNDGGSKVACLSLIHI
eukprot:TRINITY_DN62836_c0_g1_i1.p1 TRINITY_DN62836_c0_g1~~TRINITY_DN62836_c0_g1_i1.p1  ORF type:complete len:157 (+),score=44.30 TRINITY_DN62836_c0_g1_i1:44-514(+)